MRHDWDYNCAREHPEGRILLPARHVHPADAGLAEGGWTDLTDRADLQVRMTRTGVALTLGQSDATRVDGLVRARLLASAEDGWYRLRPDATLRRLFDQAAAAMHVPASRADFEAARLALKVAKAPRDVMPPDKVFLGIALQLGPDRFRQLDRVYRYVTHQRWPVARLYEAMDRAASDLGWTPGPADRSAQRDWEWSVRSRDPQRRILVRASQVHPCDRGEALPCGNVDLSDRTDPVRLLEVAVKELLAMGGGPQIFVDAGVVRRDGDHYVMVPSWTKRTLYEMWETSLGAVSTMAEFSFAKRMRKACSVPGDRMPPRAVIEGAAKLLGPRGAFTKGEVNAYMHVGAAIAKDVIAAVRAAASLPHVRDVVRLTDGEIGEEECAALFPFLSGMAGTYFDEDLGAADDRESEYDGPNAVARRRLRALGPMRDVAAAFAYGRSASVRHPAVVPMYLRAVARFEREAVWENPDFNPSCQASVDRAFEHVAFADNVLINHPDAVRDAMVRQVLIVLHDARRRIRGLASTSTRDILARTPALPSDLGDLKRRMSEQYGSLRPSQQVSRKAFSDRVSNRYERTVDGAAFRVAQIRDDGEATRAAIDLLLEPGNASLAYWDFEVEGLNLSGSGLPIKGFQKRVYRCWRIEQADLSILIDRAPDDEPPPENWPGELTVAERERVARAERRYARRTRAAGVGRGKAVLLRGSEFIVEHLGTIEVSGEGEAAKAWYVTLAENHALAPAGHLDVHQKERRDALIRRWRLPKHACTNAGLFGFDERRAVTARLASKSSRTHQRIFVPIEEFEYCVRLAAHGLDCVVQTWCRRGEFLQQTQYSEDWTPPRHIESLGWYAHGKARRGEPLPDHGRFIECADSVYQEAMALADINARRSGYEGGMLPDVTPLPQLAWKCSPQPYVFSLAGKFIENRQLGHFLRLLLANIGDFRFHDFRHASSNQAKLQGVPLVGIAAGLRQRSLVTAAYYSRLTAEQLGKAETRAVRDKLLRISRDAENRS